MVEAAEPTDSVTLLVAQLESVFAKLEAGFRSRIADLRGVPADLERLEVTVGANGTSLPCLCFVCCGSAIAAHVLTRSLQSLIARRSGHPGLGEWVVKIGAKVIAHAGYTVFQMAEVAVPRDLFRRVLAMVDGLRPTQVARC